MKRLRNPLFWFGFAEAVFGFLTAGAILEQNHPWIALGFGAAAKGANYATKFFEGEKKQNPGV